MKIFGFAGWSGSGKTTLIEKLIPLFVVRGLKVSLVKHAHHSFDMDQPGKDSYRHRHAGCTEVLVASPVRWALVHEHRGDPEPDLKALVRHLAPCDLLLVEGFKRENIPKLVVHRASVGEPLMDLHDPYVIAIASDTKVETALPQYDLNDIEGIAGCIMYHEMKT